MEGGGDRRPRVVGGGGVGAGAGPRARAWRSAPALLHGKGDRDVRRVGAAHARRAGPVRGDRQTRARARATSHVRGGTTPRERGYRGHKPSVGAQEPGHNGAVPGPHRARCGDRGDWRKDLAGDRRGVGEGGAKSSKPAIVSERTARDCVGAWVEVGVRTACSLARLSAWPTAASPRSRTSSPATAWHPSRCPVSRSMCPIALSTTGSRTTGCAAGSRRSAASPA